MEINLFDQIASRLRLRSEMTAVIVCLDEFMNDFFAPKENATSQAIFDNLPNGLAQILKEDLLKETVTHENQPIINKRIDALKDQLRAMKTIQITIAFQPDEAAINLFSEWVKKNIGSGRLIDLQFDKTIVGGAQIIADGQYKDFTVRKQLASHFQIQKDEIMSLLT